MDEPPREALPPCIRGLEIFEGNQVCWHDMDRCPKPIPAEARHIVTAGTRAGRKVAGDCANGAAEMFINPIVIEATDDEIEAEAHYKRGVEWLRGLTATVPPV